MIPSARALRLLEMLHTAMSGEQGDVNRRLQAMGYPHTDRDPNARCRLWMHGKAVVRSWSTGGGICLEVYECACGARAWVSAPGEGIRPERIR